MEQIAIYLRLSKEDEFVKDESNSITCLLYTSDAADDQ